MNSAAYNSERITYHQISMYEYEFCTSTAINQNIDRIKSYHGNLLPFLPTNYIVQVF